MKMTSNGKTLNYKVVDLIESYNFHIMFTSIRVQTNKLQNFENRMAAVSHGGRSRYSTPARGTVANAVGHGGHGGRCIVLQFFGRTPFFAKLSWKNVKKKKNRPLGTKLPVTTYPSCTLCVWLLVLVVML
jgi:hypothetical protein